MRKGTYNLNGMKLVVSGLALMTIATLATNVVDLWKDINIVKMANIGVHFLAWIFIILGLVGAKRYRTEFKKTFFIGIVGAISLIVESILIYNSLKLGNGGLTFIEIDVMFADYINTLCMAMTYYLGIRGVAQLLAKHGEIKMAKKSFSMSKWGITIIFASMIIIPLAFIFPDILKYIIAGIGIIMATGMQLFMCYYIDKGYKVLHGRNI
ncbi:MAG: hypothetical protein RR495_03710 [Anaerovoracaceae bacterium]